MDLEIVQGILQEDEKESPEALQKFIHNAENIFAFPELDKKDMRKRFWKSIYNLAISDNSDYQLISNCFTAIRILSRDKHSLNELISNEWMDLIKKHSGLSDDIPAFTPETELIAVEVEKCLSNLVFNSKVAATMCCNNGIAEGINFRTKYYKNQTFPESIKFFDMKVLFIITALCPKIRIKLRDENQGANLVQILEDILEQDAVTLGDNGKLILTGEQVDLACEILKALFNVTLQIQSVREEELKMCEQLVETLRQHLLVTTSEKKQHHTLQSNVINLLTNIPNECYNVLIPKMESVKYRHEPVEFKDHDLTAIQEIMDFLKDKFEDMPGVSQQHEVLSPVLTVLYKGAFGNRIIRKYLRSQILPPLKDVHNRPEEGNTVRNHLCRLLTTPITQLRDIAAEFLFILCKKNVSRMIKYTGYGNAAGLFARRGLLGGKQDAEAKDFSSDSEDSETEEYADHKHGINPVLGCYEHPHPNAMANMTEEQKEYEAMKLVDLMDSLTKCGTIKPCRIGLDGKPEPIEHVLQMQEGLKNQQLQQDSDSE